MKIESVPLRTVKIAMRSTCVMPEKAKSSDQKNLLETTARGRKTRMARGLSKERFSRSGANLFKMCETLKLKVARQKWKVSKY